MDDGGPCTGRPTPRSGVRLLLALVVLALSLVQPAPAVAHTELVGSDPAPGAAVSLGLDRLVLTFGEDLLASGAAITVEGPTGAEVETGATGTFDRTAAVPVALETPGRHTVSYRVVGADGHVVAGTLWFTAVAGTPPARPATPVSREALPGASADANAPGTVMWLLAAVVLVAGAVHLVGGVTRRRARVSAEARPPTTAAPPQMQRGRPHR